MTPMKMICYVVGFVFFVSGLTKFLDPSMAAAFQQMGVPFADIVFFVVALVEVMAGMLLIGRMYIHLIVPPLLFIMSGALFFSKLPTLTNEGFIAFLFASRLDIALFMLLIVLWKNNRIEKSVA